MRKKTNPIARTCGSPPGKAWAWACRAGSILLERPGADSPLRGSWDLPAIEVAVDADAARALRGRLARRGLTAEIGSPVTLLTHGIMNRRFTLSVLPCRHLRGQTAGKPDLRWIELQARDGRLRAQLFELGVVSEERITENGAWIMHVDVPRETAERLARLPGKEGEIVREQLLA